MIREWWDCVNREDVISLMMTIVVCAIIGGCVGILI